jgi:RNA polymerase sigma-70 factor (sigma-E family)
VTDVGPEALDDLERPGDEPFQAFVLARRNALLSYAHLLTGSRESAEDVLQTALVRTALAWRRVRNQGDPEGYVRVAISRTAVSAWRSRRWRERPYADPPDRPTGIDPAQQVDERDAMWQALAGLPPRQRAVLVLRYYEGLSEAEIAATLGCARGTVKSQAAKGLAHLRRLLAPQPADDGAPAADDGAPVADDGAPAVAPSDPGRSAG